MNSIYKFDILPMYVKHAREQFAWWEIKATQ